MHSHLSAAVERLLEAYQGGAAVPEDFIAAHPLSVSDGLQVQARVQAALGAVGGWKVSPSSTQEKPSFAPILRKNVHRDSARFARGAFRNVGIECEIAYRIGRDLAKPPYTRAEIDGSITGLLSLVEICDSRLANYKGASAGWRLADCGANGAVLVGVDVAGWRSIDTRRQSVTLAYNGKVVADKPGNPNADLIGVVQRLANQAGAQCGGVRAGQIVTTGSMSGNIAAQPGTEIVARFRGLGELRAVLER